MNKLKGLWKIVFGRTAILILLMLLQAFAIFGGVALLGSKSLIFNYGIGVLAVIILMYVLNARQNSSYKMMWIILILVVPILGVAFYVFTKLQVGTSFISRRVGELLDEEAIFLAPKKEVVRDLLKEERYETGLFKYLYEYGKYPHIKRNTKYSES